MKSLRQPHPELESVLLESKLFETRNLALQELLVMYQTRMPTEDKVAQNNRRKKYDQ